ncbi:MAG TPA: sulfatase-like hydrolase/transferase [Chitinophagaceae bacterium]
MTDLKKESLLVLFLPYLAYSIPRIYYSAFFSYYMLALYLFIIIVFDVVYKKINSGPSLWIKTGSILFVSGFIVFLYSNFLVLQVRDRLYESFKLEVRGRYLFIILFLLIAGIKLLFIRKKSVFDLFVNRTLLLFTLFIIVSNFFRPGVGLTAAVNQPQATGKRELPITHPQKPVLLILLDGYHSPDELGKYASDTDLYSFSNYLTSNGWQTKSRFYSYETSTVYSLSSLYNFNLSEKGNFSDITELRAIDLLDRARFADSLEKKQVKMVNFSFFNIGKNKLYTYMYPEPDGFFDLFFYYSGLSNIKIGTGDMDLKGLGSDFYSTSVYNEGLLKKLPALLDSATNNNLYIYAHFWMPHAPINFSNEINLRDYSTANYYKYWKFTGDKIKNLLASVKQLDRYRVIITGDHGFREDTRIDPHFTFAAFYGFDSASVKKVNCVQDLGKLVNDYF